MRGEVKPGDALPPSWFVRVADKGRLAYWNGEKWVPLKTRPDGKGGVTWDMPADWQQGGTVEEETWRRVLRTCWRRSFR